MRTVLLALTLALTPLAGVAVGVSVAVSLGRGRTSRLIARWATRRPPLAALAWVPGRGSFGERAASRFPTPGRFDTDGVA